MEVLMGEYKPYKELIASFGMENITSNIRNSFYALNGTVEKTGGTVSLG